MKQSRGAFCFVFMGHKASLNISLTTGLLILYVVFATLPLSFALIFSFFITTSISLLWMVYSILTDHSRPVKKTFDETFYLDHDPKREPG